MKTLTILITLLICSIGFAGPGHGHSHGDEGHGHSHGQSRQQETPKLNDASAKEAGQFHMERLIKINKVDASWTAATFDKAEQKKIKNKTEWVVTFNNEKSTDGKKLYIFLKPSGEFIAANFTGK